MFNKIRADESGFVWLHRLFDSLLPPSTLYMVNWLLNIPWHDRYLVMGVVGGLIFVLASQKIGVYQSWRGRTLFSSAKVILNAWLITWALLITISFLYQDSENFSRLAISSWALLTPFLLLSYRLIIRRIIGNYRSQNSNRKDIAIIGAGVVGQRIAKTFQEDSWLGYKVAAFYDDNKELHGTKLNNIIVKNGTTDIANAINANQYSEVYICLPLKAEQKIKQILEELTDTTAIIKFVPDLFSFNLIHSRATYLKEIPVFSVYDSPLSSISNRLIKRIEDIVISSIILTIISPLILWVAIKIKLSSPGPIIFKQKRYGINGKEINVYKFRSMTSLDNGGIIKQATREDTRTTPFGAFIRKTSLDELPQFINVIQGKMSIVGPRPHAVAHNEEYRELIPKYMQRHIVKPGITGWAQINGWRGETDTLHKMEKRIEFDLHYINDWSLWLDIKIIFLTIFRGFTSNNAY